MQRREWLVGVLALLGAGCGGGVDSGGTGTGHTSTLAVGPISGFGSIIVNGVRFDDSLVELVRAGKTTIGIAREYAQSPVELLAALNPVSAASAAASAGGRGRSSRCATASSAGRPIVLRQKAGAGSTPRSVSSRLRGSCGP